MTNQQRVLIIVIVLCLSATVGFLAIAKQSEQTANPVENSDDHGSGEISRITIDDKSSTDIQRALGSIELTTVLNQIYSEHYKLTGRLDKKASLSGEITKTSKQTQFNLVFSPSNHKLIVIVDIKNLTSNDYDLEVRKVEN